MATGGSAAAPDADVDVEDAQAGDSSAGDSASSGWPEDKYISIDEVYGRVQAGDPDLLLVNVVDEEFYDLGHIAGSLIIPWDTLEDHLDEVDSYRHIVVYCRRGVRSESAYDILMGAGYSLVWVMDGGLESWIAQGYPTVSE
jgi:rhodanese-related sulfurtransferase